jgi:CubicO group peptidase (beta-lactamase class C family)
MRLSLALACCVMTASAASAQQAPGPRGSVEARVDSIFAQWDRDDSPGCALGVYRDGAIVHSRGYGMADLERRVPITPRTVFDLGSTSKQFAATSVVLLAQEGRLSLDGDVRTYVPELPEYERPITIRHLLNHTSGLRDYIGLLVLGGEQIDGVTTADDALAAIGRQRQLNFLPGDEYLYSNSGFFLLSVIVERVAGASLRDFARERIFAPLGMERTHYLGSYDDIVPDRALAYSPRADGTLRTDISRWLQLGDGAVFSNVEELLLWDRNFYEPAVGGERLLADLQTRGRLNSGRELNYALGLNIGTHRGLPVVSHGGAWGGYRAELLRFPEQHFSVAALCNLGTINPQQLARRVADVYLADAIAAAAPQQAPAQPASAPARQDPAVDVPEARLRQLAGVYRDSASRAIRIILFEDGRLHMQLGERYPLRPLSESEFELVGPPVRVLLAFQPSVPDQPRRAVLSIAEQEPLVLHEAVLMAPSAADLAAYAGSYFSDELQATYTFVVEGDALVLHRRGAEPQRLQPSIRDEFTGGGLVFRFQRDGAGRSAGLLIDAGRIRDLGFARVADDRPVSPPRAGRG